MLLILFQLICMTLNCGRKSDHLNLPGDIHDGENILYHHMQKTEDPPFTLT